MLIPILGTLLVVSAIIFIFTLILTWAVEDIVNWIFFICIISGASFIVLAGAMVICALWGIK